METELLSRLQFAFTLSYHILWPTLSIGLSVFLVIYEALWLKTGNRIYLQHCKFWSKLFALSFGMGVVSGIVLSYEFGTNFAPFSHATGNVLGPLLTYEVLSAFFLEAGFLGVMLFGWNRVGPKLHFIATLLVMCGTLASTFWILSANSWMQTPAGASLHNGVFHADNWLQIIFNPSFPYRLAHMGTASLLTTCFFVAGISAWLLRKRNVRSFASHSLKLALLLAAVLAPAQILIGDASGLNTEEHQPMKVAAMEGRWDTMAGAPLVLFAWPDQAAATNRYALEIPKAASLILKHDANGVVKGLDQVAPENRPNVPLVFWSFRVMVGLGFLFLTLAWFGSWLILRRRLERTGWFLRVCTWATPLGFVATVAGWWVTEVGRQPWVVYGLLRTGDMVSPLAAGQVLSSLIAFVAMYSALFVAMLYYLLKVVRGGPDSGEPSPSTGAQAPARPAFLTGTEE